MRHSKVSLPETSPFECPSLSFTLVPLTRSKIPDHPQAPAPQRSLPVSSRFAVISDLHGNFIALEAVLQAIDRAGVREIICLGDIAGYGPETARCIATLRQRKIRSVRGNHDAYVGSPQPVPPDFSPDATAGIEADRASLGVSDRRFLGRLPWTLGGDDFTFVHASLPRPEDWDYVFNAHGARRHLRSQPAPVSFLGHTHVQEGWALGPEGVRRIDASKGFFLKERIKYAFNPGSVGQPRDGDPRAAFLIFDREVSLVEFHRVPYDVERAAVIFADAGRGRMGRRLLQGM